MNHSLRDARWLVVPGVLLLQAWMVRGMAKPERLPPVPDLTAFTAALGDWRQISSDALPPDFLAAMKADAVLSRSYGSPRHHFPAELLVAWFQTQTAGDRQPHSPQVCLPGAGWTPTDHGEFNIETNLGSIPVNYYVVANRGAHYAILYWYQTPQRVLASEWMSKLWLVPDAVRYHRTDVALVRVAIPFLENPQAALSSAREFARITYPLLRESLR